jgi:2-haloacid dehalogenase
MAGPIAGSVAILEELAEAGYELHALTNWSAETFPIARPRFAFLELFQTILVSGDERLVKPDARIFQLLLERIAHPAQRCVYIDDSKPNVAAAAALGFDAIPFTSPPALRAELADRGLVAASE